MNEPPLAPATEVAPERSELYILPRLLYIGDVPVEASYHGSALLHRLLESYPMDRVAIVEAGQEGSLPERRLSGVSYYRSSLPFSRIFQTRLQPYASAINCYGAPFRWRDIARISRAFEAEAILTVAHGYSWISADAFARQRGLPLHLIVHDDWPRMIRGFKRIQSWVADKFAEIYRRASRRICVSPYMAEHYERLFGVGANVIYPSRASCATVHAAAPASADEVNRPLTYAFGGTINTGGHVECLKALASVLTAKGDRLNLYGPISDSSIRRSGLALPNVRLRGLVPSKEFIDRVRSEADVLVVPMSFEAKDQANMTLCFPSKLTDYTASGLPILIHGPAYSSAVKWGRENVGVAEIVESLDESELANAVTRLRDPSHRRSLATIGLSVGEEFFSFKAARRQFEAIVGTV